MEKSKSLRSYLFPFQLYPSFVLFKANCHQTAGGAVLISQGCSGTRASARGVNTHTPWLPVQMTPSTGEQLVKALQSSSVSQGWQFTQSFVAPLTLSHSKESFFFPPFLIPPTPSFRGMRENLSALLWHSACCLRAVRPAASPDLHCIVDMLLLCQDKIYK